MSNQIKAPLKKPDVMPAEPFEVPDEHEGMPPEYDLYQGMGAPPPPPQAVP